MSRRYAVITNVCSDFGLEVCKNFAEKGYDLLITANSDEVFEAQRLLEEEGYSVEAVRVNLGSYAGVENLYSILIEGSLVDVLVICSDLYGGEIFLETALNDEIRQINYNLIAPLHLVKRVLADMRRRHKGKIIFADSDENKRFSIQGPVQKASRAFLEAFCKEMEPDLKDSGVTMTTQYADEDDILQRLQDYAFKMLPEMLRNIQKD